MSPKKLLIYVQALPTSFPVPPKKFADLNASNFVISHSSKTALAFAVSLGYPEILAAGFSPILQEALARGATEIAPMPLCDDPMEQASFFPEGDFSHIIIGENPDWLFSGASLSGVLAQTREFRLRIIARDDEEPKTSSFQNNSLFLVLDSGDHLSSIDARRMRYSTSTNVQPENVLGTSTFSPLDPRLTETISGTSAEISSLLSKKLRRLSGL